jgi:hypothetical protein
MILVTDWNSDHSFSRRYPREEEGDALRFLNEYLAYLYLSANNAIKSIHSGEIFCPYAIIRIITKNIDSSWVIIYSRA